MVVRCNESHAQACTFISSSRLITGTARSVIITIVIVMVIIVWCVCLCVELLRGSYVHSSSLSVLHLMPSKSVITFQSFFPVLLYVLSRQTVRVRSCLHDHTLRVCEHGILCTACGNFAKRTAQMHLGVNDELISFQGHTFRNQGHGEIKYCQKALWESQRFLGQDHGQRLW